MDKIQLKSFENFEVPDKIRIRKVLDFIKCKNMGAWKKCLEIGCCPGGVAEELSKIGWECTGIDICKRRVNGVQVIERDVNNGICINETFDLIFAGEVIEHLYDDKKFLLDCRKHLNPGGVLVLTTPNLCFLLNRFRSIIGKEPLFAFAPYHYHIYTRKVLDDLLKEAGFKVIKVTSSHVLFSTRRNRIGRIFEIFGDILPNFGAHLIVFAMNDKQHIQ